MDLNAPRAGTTRSGPMTTLHPSSTSDVTDALRAATADRVRVLPVGGRQHMERGLACEVDAELWTTQLDDVVAYDPAEMLAVVGAGMRIRDLGALLSPARQEWAVDAPDDATVGGVIAAGVSSPRRLRVGHVRDTVTELELVTGDGRLIRSGARTVKNVTGYDVHRLATGSLGTLGIIVQVAVKVRPLPQAVITLRSPGDGLALGAQLLGALPAASMILARPHDVTVRLEGWDAEVAELREIARASVRGLAEVDDGLPGPAELGTDRVVEAAVPPSRIGEIVGPERAWAALMGVGIVWIWAGDAEGVAAVQRRAASVGGIAPAVRGPDGMGEVAIPTGDIQRRLQASFDPAGVLAPDRFWSLA